MAPVTQVMGVSNHTCVCTRKSWRLRWRRKGKAGHRVLHFSIKESRGRAGQVLLCPFSHPKAPLSRTERWCSRGEEHIACTSEESKAQGRALAFLAQDFLLTQPLRQRPHTMPQAQIRHLHPSLSLICCLGFQFIIVKGLERADAGSSAWHTLGPFGCCGCPQVRRAPGTRSACPGFPFPAAPTPSSSPARLRPKTCESVLNQCLHLG